MMFGWVVAPCVDLICLHSHSELFHFSLSFIWLWMFGWPDARIDKFQDHHWLGFLRVKILIYLEDTWWVSSSFCCYLKPLVLSKHDSHEIYLDKICCSCNNSGNWTISLLNQHICKVLYVKTFFIFFLIALLCISEKSDLFFPIRGSGNRLFMQRSPESLWILSLKILLPISSKKKMLTGENQIFLVTAVFA